MAYAIAAASALQTASQLAEYIFGTTTTTNTTTDGTSTTNASANTTASQDTSTNSDTKTTNTAITDTNSTQDVSTNTSQDVDTKTNNTVSNTADPGVLGMLKQLASTAISNSNDPSKTTDLLTGILQQAGDAMTSIFGQQKQSGLYNSSATASQTNDILSRAAAEASSAILGYKTSQQNIANAALNQLAASTATQTTTGDTNQLTTNSSDQVTKLNSNATTTNISDVATNSDVKDTASTSLASTNTVQATQNSQSTSNSSGSIICTWMFDNKKLPSRLYYISAADFAVKNPYKKLGYYSIARPLLSLVKKKPLGMISLAVQSIFKARTVEVCAQKNIRGCEKSWYGKFAVALVATVVFFPGFIHWVKSRKLYNIQSEIVELPL